MEIKTLNLIQFRNYEKQTFHFHPLVNIIIGDNAQGKTNILEAIYLLSTTRSFKSRMLDELIMFDQSYTRVSGHVVNGTRPYDLKVVVSKEGKKAFINDKAVSKTSDYLGYFNVILFTPQDLQLIKGSPKMRRTLIDTEISKISPIYMFNLNKYNKLMKERNKYLKMLHDGHKEPDMYLEVLSEEMAELEEDLIQRRMKFIELLNEISGQMYAYISGKEKLVLRYHTQFKDISKEGILAKYKKNYKRDIFQGNTVDGIHKDDLKIFLDENDAGMFASQGQQRSIILSMKIALVEIVKMQIGEYPVLLLDDVLSELDEERKMKLLNLIDHKVQTFITTTHFDLGYHHSLDDALVLRIEKGTLKEDKLRRYAHVKYTL